MPEGHLIHWLANRHARLLAGTPVVATSPQGRFVEGAAQLDGATLEEVEAVGKHLLYEWDRPLALHVHLGQVGKFVEHGAETAPIPGARLRLVTNGTAVELVAPSRCELIDEAARAALTSRLGPDPLRDDADPEPVWLRIADSPRPIGALLLDQQVLAGVGNVLRAEVLNIVRVHPEERGADLGRERFDALWATLGEVMREAAEHGRIITVPGAIDQDDGRYVYKQERCRRCGTPVASWSLANRQMYACPRCQPAPVGASTVRAAPKG